MQSTELLEQILSDAHVVDADLSGWDKAIDVCVLADHMPHTETDRLPLLRVQFIIGVSSFRLQIDVTAAAEEIDCGRGVDIAWLDRGDIARRCERVRRSRG